MIDAETIEDMNDCDGEFLHAYGYDPDTKPWQWRGFRSNSNESGRGDIIERLTDDACRNRRPFVAPDKATTQT
jgi:hypothetical protein